MTNYARLYRFGITPWERYRTAAAASITARGPTASKSRYALLLTSEFALDALAGVR
jgi:hypothetical protein